MKRSFPVRMIFTLYLCMMNLLISTEGVSYNLIKPEVIFVSMKGAVYFAKKNFENNPQMVESLEKWWKLKPGTILLRTKKTGNKRLKEPAPEIDEEREAEVQKYISLHTSIKPATNPRYCKLGSNNE